MQTHPISCRVTAPSPTQPSTRFSPSSSTPEGLQSSLTHQSPTTHAPPTQARGRPPPDTVPTHSQVQAK